MPSGNTNIMKEYKERFESLKEFRYETCKQDFDKYLNKCNDILYLDDYWDWIKDEISKCENYIHDLKIVLKVNQLKDEREYREYLDDVTGFLNEYNSQLNSMERYIEEYRRG